MLPNSITNRIPSRRANSRTPKIYDSRGLWPFFYKPLLELLDIRVFVDTPRDVRLARLLLRNIVGGARGWTIQSVLEYYLECVRPMQIEYIDKGKELAHILVNGESSLAQSVEQIIQVLNNSADS